MMQNLVARPSVKATSSKRAASRGAGAGVGAHQPVLPRSAVVTCSSKHQDVQLGLPTGKQVLAGLLAAATAVSMVVLPPSAEAVSGGGGISEALDFKDLSGQDLRKNKFTKAIMRGTKFENCNLTGVSLFGAFAEGASFRGANLTNADLESGVFTQADFSDAILSGAYVNNAQFQDTKIANSDWTDVILRKDVQKYLCKRAEGTNPVTGVDTRESLGCF